MVGLTSVCLRVGGLEILSYLRDGEKSVSGLLSLIGSSKANLSQHLTVLRQKRIYNQKKGSQYFLSYSQSQND